MQKLPPVGAFINKGNTQIWLYILVIFYLAIPQHQVQLPAPIQPQAKPLHQFTSNINISGSSMIACAIARRCRIPRKYFFTGFFDPGSRPTCSMIRLRYWLSFLFRI